MNATAVTKTKMVEFLRVLDHPFLRRHLPDAQWPVPGYCDKTKELVSSELHRTPSTRAIRPIKRPRSRSNGQEACSFKIALVVKVIGSLTVAPGAAGC